MLVETPLPRIETHRQRLTLPDGAGYLYRALAEEVRGTFEPEWEEAQLRAGARFFEVLEETPEQCSVRDSNKEIQLEVSLFDASSLIDHLSAEGVRELWIDITALAFGTWAAIVREGLEAAIPMTLVYAEPAEYVRSSNPLHGLRFNLSERTSGLAPLPGFASLWNSQEESRLLVPLLGFEGDRLQRVLEETQFDTRRIFPIVGAPGFQPEYTFYSLDGNGLSLGRNPLHRNVRFARANCPFEAFLAVEELRKQEAATHITLAPIGTKPHALGALMQQLLHPDATRIIYDHPVRSKRRTAGAARLCVYKLSEFLAMLDSK